MTPLDLRVRACDRTFSIASADPATAALVHVVFGGLAVAAEVSDAPVRRYFVEPLPDGFRVWDGSCETVLEDEDSLLFHLDKEIILALQYERPDLLFLHAAALAGQHRVAVLCAPSGTGKSTLTLAAMGSGLAYLSDELAPIDVSRMEVHPYPHALCLKSPPPPPHRLPAATVAHAGRFQVPVRALGGEPHLRPLPLAAFIFLRREPGRESGLRPISRASAVARLMANTLNALAHPNAGLDVTVALSEAVPCFELDLDQLSAAVDAIASVLADDDPVRA